VSRINWGIIWANSAVNEFISHSEAVILIRIEHVMKIGILIDRLTLGGAEKVAIQQVHALRAIGEDAQLLVLRRKGITKDPFPDLTKNIPIVYLDDRLPEIFKYSFKFPKMHFFNLFHVTYPFFIPWTIRKKEYDYIISHLTYTTFTAIMIKKIKGISFSSVIWDPIGSILERVYTTAFPKPLFVIFFGIAKALDTSISKNSNVILVGGAAHNDYLESVTDPKKIITLPPAITPLKTPLKKKGDHILLVTSWKKGKNPEYIIELMEALPDLKVKMAGGWLEDDFRKEFEQKIKDHKLSQRIEILGKITEEQLSELFKEARFFLQMKDDRGFGLPALEAAGNCTTFIIPKGQGVCELFTNSVDGFFVNAFDTNSIVKHMQRLLSDKELAMKMGRHAWETIKDTYTWDNYAKELVAIAKKHSL
jgi:glycosyltransferase involved in cell wall biosynthesis